MSRPKLYGWTAVAIVKHRRAQKGTGESRRFPAETCNCLLRDCLLGASPRGWPLETSLLDRRPKCDADFQHPSRQRKGAMHLHFAGRRVPLEGGASPVRYGTDGSALLRPFQLEGAPFPAIYGRQGTKIISAVSVFVAAKPEYDG